MQTNLFTLQSRFNKIVTIHVMKPAFVFFLCTFAFMSFGDPGTGIPPFIGEETYSILADKQEISRVIRQKETLTLFPSIPAKATALKKIADMDPGIGVEFLFLINAKHGKSLLTLYNRLVSVSTLKGILYYSETRKKDAILYTKAFAIDSPKTKKQIKDPVFDSIPYHHTLFAYFKDSSLGEYYCTINYIFTDNAFMIEMENITAINYFFLPIVQPNGLLTYIIIIPFEEEILFYGFSCLKITNIFGIQEGKIKSLYNRVKAYYRWFVVFIESR